MKVLFRTNSAGPECRYIVADDFVKGNYLVVFGYGIYTTSDFKTPHYIGGLSNLNGYVNGAKSLSRFSYINGIASSPTTDRHIWISDQDNSCFRTLDRLTNITSDLTGVCGGFRRILDGDFASAEVAYPFGMAVSPSENKKIYFYESSDGQIRCLLQVGSIWSIQTITNLNEDIAGLTFDPTGTFLYFTTNSSIMRVSSTWRSSPETIISGFGHNDGALNSAKMRESKYLHFLDSQNILLTDYKNHVLRVVDLTQSYVSSICLLQSSDVSALGGSIATCKLEYPRNFVASREASKIYIIGDHSIYSLGYTGEFSAFSFEYTLPEIEIWKNFTE